MHHFFEAITNTSGQSLVGYFARVIDPGTLNTVTLSSDENGTPIITVSGVANMGVTDDYGNLSFYVDPGTYHLDIYAADSTTFVYRVPNVAMNSSKGDTGAQGVQGDTGTSDSAFLSLASLKAINPAAYPSPRLAAPAGSDGGVVNGPFTYQLGNFTGRTDVVFLNSDPTGDDGALVRQGAQSVAYTAPGATVTGNVDKSIAIRPTTPQELRGVPNDGSASTHAAFLALENTDRDMIVPPGDYLYDNSTLRLIHYYEGEITFAPGARLIATDSTKPLFYFVGGSPKVRGLTCTTRDNPTVVGRQNNSAMLRFDDTIDAICSDVVIERGAGAGILVLRGTGFRGNNIVVRNTLADGFDFFNSSDFTLSDLLAFNTGDDGLGIVSYADGPPIVRGTLSNINIRQTNTRGISFVGCTNVVLDGFLIEETQGDGIIIERDDTAVTHTPTGVRIMNGNIIRAGQRVVDPNYIGEKHGLKIGQSGTVDVIGVTIVNSKSRGFSANSVEINAHLYVDGVRVETAGDEGFFFYNHRSVTYGSITAQNTRATGIRTLNVDRLFGDTRIAIHAPREGASNRAVWDVNNGYQQPGRTIIEDLNGPSTAFIYRVEGNGRGSSGTVTFNQTGAYYVEVVAPYMTIGATLTKRDDISPGNGNILLSPYEAWDRKIYAALTVDNIIGLPTFGMVHGDEVSMSRYDGSGTFSVIFQDRNNANTVVTTIPPGTPMVNRVFWDAVGARWRARGKANL